MSSKLLLAFVVFFALFYDVTAFGFALLRSLKDILCGQMPAMMTMTTTTTTTTTTSTTSTLPPIMNLTQNATGAFEFIMRVLNETLSDPTRSSPVIYAPIFNWAQVSANETST